MKKFDYSKLSDEELMQLASKFENEEKEEQSNLLQQALQGYGHYAKGVFKGGSQALGDIGASVGNLGISGLEKISGREIPHIPHPHLTDESSGIAESIGQHAGGLLPMVLPGLGGAGAAGLLGKEAPLIAKLLAGGAGGAAAGYASNEENRPMGAALGALGGVVGAGYPSTPHLTRRGASKKLRLADKLARERGLGKLNVPSELIEDVRQFLPETTPYRNLLEKAQGKKYEDLFKLQSDVNKFAGPKSKAFFSFAERAHGKEGLASRQRLLEHIRKSLEEQGHHDISDLMKKGQRDYARHMKIRPYRKAVGATAALAALPHDPLTNLISKLLFHK